MSTGDDDAYTEMQKQQAADLAGENGDEAQAQAVLDEVDAMLASTIGALSITGAGDVQVTQAGDTHTLIVAP